MDHNYMSLYGHSPEQEVFSVVTCYSCGMVLRPSAFNDHLRKRHSYDSLTEEINIRPKIKSDLQSEVMQDFLMSSPIRDQHESSSPIEENSAPIGKSYSLMIPPKEIATASNNDQLKSTVSEPQLKRKREKFEPNPNISSYPLGHSPKKIVDEAESFHLPNPPKKRIAHKPKQRSEDINLKVKFKKTNHGMWSVVTV